MVTTFPEIVGMHGGETAEQHVAETGNVSFFSSEMVNAWKLLVLVSVYRQTLFGDTLTENEIKAREAFPDGIGFLKHGYTTHVRMNENGQWERVAEAEDVFHACAIRVMELLEMFPEYNGGQYRAVHRCRVCDTEFVATRRSMCLCRIHGTGSSRSVRSRREKNEKIKREALNNGKEKG